MVYYNKKYVKLNREKRKNYRTLNGIDYLFSDINPDYDRSKGGNSSVFIANNVQADEEEYIIKISNANPSYKSSWNTKRVERFEREIEALYRAKEEGLKNVINIYDDGIIDVYYYDKKYNLRYYLMEKGEIDLKEYVLSGIDLDLQQKLELCNNISLAIDQLNQIDVYHRDVKPDNIFLVNDMWKIGDLGLINSREDDYIIDEINDRIGPFGWHSPETMNKYLTEEKDLAFGFDCDIDHQSDLFQLGMLFWFIFQGNAPIGQLIEEDFLPDVNQKTEIFNLIYRLVSYNKDNRIENSRELLSNLHDIGHELGVA